MRAQESGTGAVVEALIKVDGLDVKVKVVEEFEKLSDDIAGGVARDELAHRQRVTLVAYPFIRISRTREINFSFRLRDVQRLCLVLIIVVGIEVEVCTDLHRSIRKCHKRISLQERSPTASIGSSGCVESPCSREVDR